MTTEAIRKLANAAKHMDWMQVVLNHAGGPPCFHLEAQGGFCGRAKRWHGHDASHKFVSFEDLILSVAPKPLTEIGREELGRRFYETETAIAIEQHGPSAVQKWEELPELRRNRYVRHAETFAQSIAEVKRENGKCAWRFSPSARGHISECLEGRYTLAQLSPTAMCWQFCPFCGKEIQEGN
jgi:hypothetical protein